MKRFIGFAASLALPLTLAGCPGDDTSSSGTESNTSGPTGGETDSADGTATGAEGCVGIDGPRSEVATAIDGDTTLGCDRVHVLTGITLVNSGTLTIEPGTWIVGGAGSALAITPAARIDAQGTADAPIVMTSIQVADGGSPARGDWGGLALLGLAEANIGMGPAEGFAEDPPIYGGSDNGHDCGTLSYVRVEWAGNEISPGNELNGITFFACGTATSVDHVQVHMGLDDGIEMFGGTFDANNIIVTGAADDSIDSDEGFRGTLQDVFIHQDPTTGDNCLEWSNQGTDFTAPPLTNPTISNLTCVGSGSGGTDSKGATLKEGVQATIRNSLFVNATNAAIVLANLATQAQAEAGAISFPGTHFCGTSTFEVDAGDDMATWDSAGLEMWLTETAGATIGTDCMLPDATFGSPNIQPAAEIAGEGGYAGAVDPAGDNWTLDGWINYGT
ncbi:hypothetical protein [Paraliomyxa miuraensis]|uniref:hypothetical protein n=1 Tax=Paraliomyxa miuraensis TaxID=376150 RepID=UPI0022583ECE|nr:hypothetical protein [Paraliomyxa miuraensis]MCX4241245.1 hypothetical protein [Paraliomyxa miuraensis]